MDSSIANSVDLVSSLAEVLSRSVSVSQEIEALLSFADDRQVDILLNRYGFEQNTLGSIGIRFSLTRERIRQIERKVVAQLATATGNMPLLRIRSALLFAHDNECSFDYWLDRLIRTGLMGVWTDSKLQNLDQLELLVGICCALKESTDDFSLPPRFDSYLRN